MLIAEVIYSAGCLLVRMFSSCRLLFFPHFDAIKHKAAFFSPLKTHLNVRGLIESNARIDRSGDRGIDLFCHPFDQRKSEPEMSLLGIPTGLEGGKV